MKYSQELFKNNTNNCTICLENYIDQKSLICLTPCNHIFHYDCIKKWSLNNTGLFKCPNCNFDFMKEKEFINSNKLHINQNNINNINTNDKSTNVNLNSDLRFN